MAQTAQHEADEQEAIEVQKPDFERALKVLKHDVRPAEEQNAKSRGDLSAAWKIIEDDCHCVKGAAKVVHKLMNMSDEKRDDWLRTFSALCSAANIGISRDLVDQMGDGETANVVPIVEPGARDGLATLQPELTH